MQTLATTKFNGMHGTITHCLHMIFRSNVEGKMNKSAEKQATKRGKHTQNKMKWKKETLLTMDLEQSNTFFM